MVDFAITLVLHVSMGGVDLHPISLVPGAEIDHDDILAFYIDR
jgi:hypothetical protein